MYNFWNERTVIVERTRISKIYWKKFVFQCSANQIEKYENSRELNIRHFVSIFFRLLRNKDYRPPSWDVKALMLSYFACSPALLALFRSSRFSLARYLSRIFAAILCIVWDTRTLANTTTNMAEFELDLFKPRFLGFRWREYSWWPERACKEEKYTFKCTCRHFKNSENQQEREYF